MFHDVQTELQEYLKEGEILLWADQPKKGLVFRKSEIFMAPFSLFWLGFSVFWVTMTRVIGTSLWFSLFGVPFVLIGIFLVFGRFILDMQTRANTVYGLTSERILILKGRKNRFAKSIPIESLGDIECEERSDGSGTIRLRRVGEFAGITPAIDGTSSRSGLDTLDLIPDVRQVFKQISALQLGDVEQM
ncbi:MAG: hypothetical protein H6581_16895 [Bacteroidia bacterium]|nr:hypothetical protein [Bacteroidia bacterium]